MSVDMNVPGWLPGKEPNHHEVSAFLVRASVVERTTLTERQIFELVKDGRLEQYRVPANKTLTMFKVSDLNTLFTPVAEDRQRA